MCTTYYLENTEPLRRMGQTAENHKLRYRMMSKIAQPVVTQGEARPGDIVPVIAPDSNGEGHVYPMIWGFSGKLSLIPRLDIDLLAQTRNPILLDAWARHRCLIPTSWYYEWERLKPEIDYDSYGDQTSERDRRYQSIPQILVPEAEERIGDRYMIQTRGSSVTFLAGIYRIEDLEGVKVPHFMVLMQYAAPNLMFIHNQMPVIFDADNKELLKEWLDPGAMPPWDVERVLNNAVMDVMYEKSPVRRKKKTVGGF